MLDLKPNKKLLRLSLPAGFKNGIIFRRTACAFQAGSILARNAGYVTEQKIVALSISCRIQKRNHFS
jgi:hypothetical protein